MTRSIIATSVFAAVFGITTLGVIADQSSSPQPDKQKPAAQADKAGAKPHTMTGCLEKGADATMFKLTNVEGTGPKTVELHADASKKLAAHVGHKVAITGTDVDPTTLKKGTTGKPEPGAPAASATEHHMNVNSLKHVSETCQ